MINFNICIANRKNILIRLGTKKGSFLIEREILMKKIILITSVALGLANYLDIVGYLPPGNYKDSVREQEDVGGDFPKLEWVDAYYKCYAPNCSFSAETQTLNCPCWSSRNDPSKRKYSDRKKSYCFIYNYDETTGDLVCDLSWIKETPQATMDYLKKNFTQDDLTNQRQSLIYQACTRPKSIEMINLLIQNGLGPKNNDWQLLRDCMRQAQDRKDQELIGFLKQFGAREMPPLRK